ncbi:MAG: hypothetical protein ACRCUS_05925 [Anaerovoracaceae bacterium]
MKEKMKIVKAILFGSVGDVVLFFILKILSMDGIIKTENLFFFLFVEILILAMFFLFAIDLIEYFKSKHFEDSPCLVLEKICLVFIVAFPVMFVIELVMLVMLMQVNSFFIIIYSLIRILLFIISITLVVLGCIYKNRVKSQLARACIIGGWGWL